MVERSCTLKDSRGQGTTDGLWVYMRSPSKFGLKRAQFVRITNTTSQDGGVVYRYLLPGHALTEKQLHVGWQTAIELGFDFQDLEQDTATVRVEPATAVRDHIRYFLFEKNPQMHIARTAGIVGGVMTGLVFLLLGLLIG